MLSIGLSSVQPSIYILIHRYIHINNSLASVLTSCSALMTTIINALNVFEVIRDEHIYTILVINLTSLITTIISFVSIWSSKMCIGRSKTIEITREQSFDESVIEEQIEFKEFRDDECDNAMQSCKSELSLDINYNTIS